MAGFRYPFLFFTNIKRIRIEWVAQYPIGSMYGIYTNIGGILMAHVTIYSIHGSYGILVTISSSVCEFECPLFREHGHLKHRRPSVRKPPAMWPLLWRLQRTGRGHWSTSPLAMMGSIGLAMAMGITFLITFRKYSATCSILQHCLVIKHDQTWLGSWWN